jgi:hypothetical protein
MAGDMKIDLARLLDDLVAYKTDDAGRPVLPKDRDSFVLHLTALHGISQTGAAAQYLYPVFAKHIGETATHFGPSFAALRQIDKRLQRKDLQFRLLDDEGQERKFNQLVADLTGADRQRRLQRGLLRVLEENQAPAEMSAEPSVVVASAKIGRTDALSLSQDSKIWMVAGNRGSSSRDAVESLCTPDKPVYPILLLLSTDDPSQREIIGGGDPVGRGLPAAPPLRGRRRVHGGRDSGAAGVACGALHLAGPRLCRDGQGAGPTLTDLVA